MEEEEKTEQALSCSSLFWYSGMCWAGAILPFAVGAAR